MSANFPFFPSWLESSACSQLDNEDGSVLVLNIWPALSLSPLAVTDFRWMCISQTMEHPHKSDKSPRLHLSGTSSADSPGTTSRSNDQQTRRWRKTPFRSSILPPKHDSQALHSVLSLTYTRLTSPETIISFPIEPPNINSTTTRRLHCWNS